jgi:pyruvate ferredoxin oxidoreductase delta subunit
MKDKGWKDIPIGGLILEAGNAERYKTGGWRTFRPLWDEEVCIQCLRCWIYCPDNSIVLREEKMVDINYDYCKGCGICFRECPTEAIKMMEEGEYLAKKREGK